MSNVVEFDPHKMAAELLLCNCGADERAADVDAETFDLRPWEARIYRLSSKSIAE